MQLVWVSFAQAPEVTAALEPTEEVLSITLAFACWIVPVLVTAAGLAAARLIEVAMMILDNISENCDFIRTYFWVT